MKKKLIIIGGGASGIACAIQMKKLNPDFQVTILEQNDRIGKKILKTGNGRCNISNSDICSSYYNNSSFVEQCFKKITLEDVILFFKEIGLLVKNDSSTRLYPYSESAKTVLEVFLYELNHLGIQVLCNQEVIKIEKEDKFIITSNSLVFAADYVIVATGSMAQEKTKGYQLLKYLGHNITILRPGLVALRTIENLRPLQGIRIKCQASIYNNNQLAHQEEGEILFKEQGLSGILALNLSRYVQENCKVYLDLFPNIINIEEELREILKYKNINDALLGLLPKMVVYEVLKRSSNSFTDIYQNLRALSFEINGDYGFEQAQIVLGGVNISEINYDFSSKLVEDLYIIGELLDVDGASGGYNLHFAWISGITAANSIFEKNK